MWLVLSATAGAAPRAVEVGNIVWTDPGFGSFSGIEVSRDGTGFATVSDKGRFATGRLTRDAKGRLSAAEVEATGPLLDSAGRPLDGVNIDAEGLSRGPGDAFYVSYEANHRVARHAALDQAPTLLPRTAEIRRLQNNSGLEALFVTATSLCAIPERSGALDRPFPVYCFEAGRWRTVAALPRRPPHLVVGADWGPDGKVYVLERHFAGVLGFSTRIRRFSVPLGRGSREETVLETRVGAYGNLEGLSAWLGADGRVRLTLIADDNESIFQSTRIVEFAVEEDPAPRPKPRPDG